MEPNIHMKNRYNTLKVLVPWVFSFIGIGVFGNADISILPEAVVKVLTQSG